MNEAMTMEAPLLASAEPQVERRSMPLSFLRQGERARVAKVRGRGELHHHLENLGFVAGAPVSVACEQGGNLIVEVKGARVALDRQTASRVITM